MILTVVLCRIAKREGYDYVISVESKEVEYCDFRNPPLHRNSVVKAKPVLANPDETTDFERGGGFAEWAMLALPALRIELN